MQVPQKCQIYFCCCHCHYSTYNLVLSKKTVPTTNVPWNQGMLNMLMTDTSDSTLCQKLLCLTDVVKTWRGFPNQQNSCRPIGYVKTMSHTCRCVNLIMFCICLYNFSHWVLILLAKLMLKKYILYYLKVKVESHYLICIILQYD